jgi:hypothetical protein
MNHTPGPWKLHARFNVVSGDPENDPHRGGVGKGAGRFIATVEPDYAHARNAFNAPGAAAEANARLIAAAPELLAVAESLVLRGHSTGCASVASIDRPGARKANCDCLFEPARAAVGKATGA